MVYAIKQFAIQDTNGNLITDEATVTVTREDGSGIAAIYSDRDGNTPKPNPFTTNNGIVEFYAPGGAYRIDITAGSFTGTWRYSSVGTAAERDADELGQLEAGLRWRELVQIGGSDLDNLLVAGFYSGSNLTNAPGASSDKFYVLVLTNQENPEDAIQIAWNEGASPAIYMRCRISTGWGSWASAPSTGAANAWTAQQWFSIATLTDASTISWDVAGAQVAKVTLTTNRTLGNPTNAQEGGVYILIVINSGSDTLSFGSAYEWPNDDPPDTGDDAAGERSVFTFIYENSKMRGVGALKYPA